MNLKTDKKWPKDLKMKKKDSWNMSKKLESEGTEKRRSRKNAQENKSWKISESC